MVYASAPSSAPELFEQAPAAKGVQSTFSPAHLKTVVSVKRRNLRVALQSGSNFHKYIQTPGSDLGPSGSAVWINDGVCVLLFLLFRRFAVGGAKGAELRLTIWGVCVGRSSSYSSGETDMAVV